MATKIKFSEYQGWGFGYLALLGGLGLLVVAGLGAAWFMEHNGHWVTGMNNQIVWGMPHVFAVFLIVAASGALNVASMATVFNKTAYKPLSRLSGLLAIALLVGGLSVLMLDLGRPDRMIVAMTKYNFKSIFAWNIFLYTGFLGIVAVYLWFQMERRMQRYATAAGWVAFVWRLVLTTGTGSIFGFLVAREAWDAAVMAPLFIAMSFSFGLAAFLLVLMVSCAGAARPLGDLIPRRLGKLLAIFVAAVLYFTTVQHLTNLYAAEHAGVERFLLLDGGAFTSLFWIGQIALGGLLPLALLLRPGAGRKGLALACALVILGGLVQVYVIIVGGQAWPLVLFPGMEVTSSFFDGAPATYAPSLYEIALGISGVAIALLIVAVGVKVLAFLPESLADAAVDPHHARTPVSEPASAGA
ncbi:MAG: NrfD/PsrC family molybdoenzyme membrane anchor subunit [Alphaproteobacteria bacterium]